MSLTMRPRPQDGIRAGVRGGRSSDRPRSLWPSLLAALRLAPTAWAQYPPPTSPSSRNVAA